MNDYAMRQEIFPLVSKPLTWGDAVKGRSAIRSDVPSVDEMQTLPRVILRRYTGHAYDQFPGDRHDEWLMRLQDIVIASAALFLLLPFFIVAALAIKLSSRGPVFFRQDRYGLNGEIFRIYKFRTMKVDQGDASGRQQTVRDDPRVTWIGKFLRKSSLDELPQLLNILRGDMAVVGPRPHVPGMIANGVTYESFDERYMDRCKVRPGLTGLAQIKGFRGETNSEYTARMRLEYDLQYIAERSALLNLKIFVATLRVEFIGGGGY